MAGKVAVVTGSHRGLGYAIIKQLLSRGVETAYVTTINLDDAKEAVEKLKQDGYNAIPHQLDVTDKNSVKTLADFVKENNGGVDILINNAGVAPENFLQTTYEDSKRVININYYGILNVQEFFFPILKENARVINITSDCGHPSNLENMYWVEHLTKKDLSLEDIDVFISWFLDQVKNGTLSAEEFKGTNLLSYRVSKLSACALTRVQQRQVDRNVSVNSVHPGFIRTDMTDFQGLLTADEAAEAPVYLALDVDQSVKGKYFWCDKSEKDWDDYNLQLHVNRKELVDYMDNIDFYGKF